MHVKKKDDFALRMPLSHGYENFGFGKQKSSIIESEAMIFSDFISESHFWIEPLSDL